MINMAVVDLPAQEGSLTIDGRCVGDVALTEYLGISLGEVLRTLNFGVNFVYFLYRLSSNDVNRGGAQLSRITEHVAEGCLRRHILALARPRRRCVEC